MIKTSFGVRVLSLLTAAILFGAIACSSIGNDNIEPCNATPLDATDLCDPLVVTFSPNSTNPYYPLVAGNYTVLTGEKAGQKILIQREVTDQLEPIEVNGIQVNTHQLIVRKYINDEIHQININYLAEADDGTVCTFGTYVEVYFWDHGVNTDYIPSAAGTWMAGVDGALPGIVMPATPTVGQVYFQAQAPGVVMSIGRITSIEAARDIGGTEFQDVVTVYDLNPLDSCNLGNSGPKRYVPGIGEAAGVDVELTSFTAGT